MLTRDNLIRPFIPAGPRAAARRPCLRAVTLIACTLVLLAGGPGAPFQTTLAAASTRPSAVMELTLEQKVGQLFMVSLYGQGLPDTGKAFLKETLPGGVALFTSNGGTPAQYTATVNAWQAAAIANGAHIPLLVATDQEGGTVVRLQEKDGFSSLPSGWALGAMNGESAVVVGRIAAEEMRAVGIMMNLAPIADVQTVRSNPLMDRRTLGSDPNRVAQNAIRYAAGLQDAGVIATFKHFPGHGDAGDSHTLLPVINYPIERVRSVDLLPFREAIRSGTAQVIMVGHLVYPALDPTPGLPASLSKKILTDLLRTEMGFTGVAMTDAMDMAAIADNFGETNAAVMAINAGIDIVTMGPHMPLSKQRAMIKAVLEAARNGTISAQRLDEAVNRVLRLKAKYGMLVWSPLDPKTAKTRVNRSQHQEMLQQLWGDSITASDDAKARLPIPAAGLTSAIVYPGLYRTLPRRCQALSRSLTSLSYHESPTRDDIANAATLARKVDQVVVLTYDAISKPAQQELVEALPPDRTIVVALQNPYDLALFPEYTMGMATYSPNSQTFDALCEVLYGARTPKGTLPVRIG